MRLLLAVLFFLVNAVGYAQIKSVAGTVVDSIGQPLANVTVSLEGTAENRIAKTDNAGTFQFSNPLSKKFILRYSLIGYETYLQDYTEDRLSDKSSLLIDTVRLKQFIQLLPEVILTPTLPVTIKEDTVEYRADAYKVREGAMVEDLLKKLPGITVSKEGVVSAQGREVTRVRVNGKDYFGGDLLTATRNLPAGVVENIQVIEDYGDEAKHTGIKEGEAEKILNINLKKGKENGSFGNANLVAGTKGRYLTSVAANNFKGEKQLSILGSFNNTNASSFDFSSGARGGGYRSVNPASNDRGAVGVSQYTSLGVNYRNAWGKKLTAYGSYSYTARRNRTRAASFQQDFNTENISAIKSDNESFATGNNHRINWNVEYKMDSMNYLKLSPFISAAGSENKFAGSSEYTRSKFYTLSNGNNKNADAAPAWGSDIFYNHRFAKQGRNLSVSAMLNHASREQDRDVTNSYYNVDSSYSQPLASYTTQDQLIDNFNVNKTSNLRISFAERLTKNMSLELSYAWNRTNSETRRSVDDIDQMTGEKITNDSQSNDFRYTFTTNRLGLNFFRTKKKYNYSIGLSGQPVVLTGMDERRNIATKNTNFNLIPAARFVYKFTQNQSLTATYGGASREPGFAQLQPVSDSSNLKTIVTGNPNLKPEFTNRFRLQYNKAGLLTGRALFANIGFEQTQNKIVGSRTNEANGTGRTISYLNTDGFYGLNANMSLSQPLFNKRLVLSFNTTGSFDNNISYTDNQKNTGHNWTLRPELLLRIDLPDKMDLTIGCGYTYNKNTTRYTAAGYSSEVQTLNLGINGKNYLLKDWTLGYDLSRTMYFGYLKTFNANPTLLSLFVERRFLKNNKGLVRLQGFDLLDQNSGISRNINGTTITDLQSNRLSRYFLVSFNYRLQRFGGK